jgi:hypothetical protein
VCVRLLSATCIEVVLAIVLFNLMFREAVETLDPRYSFLLLLFIYLLIYF